MQDKSSRLTEVTKITGYDIIIINKKVRELQEENKGLRERVKYLHNLINEYIHKMEVNLSGGKVDEFLKEQKH